MDARLQKLAKLLINYSLKLKKGKLFKIMGEPVTMPLILAAYDEALKVGAYPYIEVILPDALETLLKNGSPDQIRYQTPMRRVEANKMDAYLYLWGSQNLRFQSGVDPKRSVMYRKGRDKISKRIFKRIGEGTLSWVGTQFPTQADAQEAGMSLTDYEDFVFRAGNLHLADPVKHWKKVEKEQKRLVRILNRVDRLHIRSTDTDLKVRVKGRKWISCHGTENFPDGEIFTSPIEDSAEGHIHYSYPALHDGRKVEDIRLEFKKGRVVAETAGAGKEFLTAALNVDPGARRVGEVAIGTNYQIKESTGNTLFDEKIGGTCHLAVGAAFAESGGKNQSAIHWDMVCDLRKNGEITADGKVIYRKGKFTI